MGKVRVCSMIYSITDRDVNGTYVMSKYASAGYLERMEEVCVLKL